MLLLCADTKDSSMLFVIRLRNALSSDWYLLYFVSPSSVGLHPIGVGVDDSCVWYIYPMRILLMRPLRRLLV